MENQIQVVSYKGKNYFSVTSSGGIEFLVTFLHMKYFAGEKEYEFYHIEGWRKERIVLNGYVSHYTRNCFAATFDLSDISPIHTKKVCGEMREFESLSVKAFLPGDSIITAIPGGPLIANELHLAFGRALASQEIPLSKYKVSKKREHVDRELRYEEISENRILIPGSY